MQTIINKGTESNPRYSVFESKDIQHMYYFTYKNAIFGLSCKNLMLFFPISNGNSFWCSAVKKIYKALQS